ncbi:MAG: M1 family aminopeptidase, partial [Acidobacteriota bacterium]
MTRLLPYCIGLLSILFPASMIADDVVIADEVAIAPQTAAVLADVLAAEIDLDDARAVEGLRLDTGFAQLRFHDGKLFPVRTPEGHVVEMVFIGRGSLVVELDDAIESSQLELFTGGEVLEETFTEAVFAVALDTASEALLSRPPAASGVLDSASRWAKHRSATWRDSQMRDLLSIDTAMTLDRLGDPFYGGYFGAWFKGDRVGEMLLSVQPEAVEQLTLGQFRPFDLQASDQGRKIEKELKKMQRKGRFVGLEIDELGSWDTWVSTPLRRDGEPHQGFAAFEPLHYRLAVDLDPDERTIHGTARIDLRPSVDGVRSAGLKLPETFQIDAVRDGAGNPLVYHRVDDDLRVFFPSPVDSDQTVEIAYHGMGLTEYKRAWVPHSNTSWYPRTGSVDRATYEIELSWPKRWTMLASGRLEDEGMRGDIRWQKRRLDRPGLAVSFTFGTFRVEELEVGHVDVTVAFDDSLVRWASGRRDVVTTAVKSSLSYFETIFGAYPDDELVIVTVPTFVSQALPGFIHLANVELTDELTSAGDRGTLIAHEISHQWWGNSVGWVGYRDQWLTEALANYSALLWARHGTDDET